MADAVDRKHHHVGATDKTFEQTASLLDASVMVEEVQAAMLAECAKMVELILPTADIK